LRKNSSVREIRADSDLDVVLADPPDRDMNFTPVGPIN
jgi:hypothetical protein